MGNLKEYKQFCQTEHSLPIFMKSVWMDAICGENTEVVQNWSVALAKDEKGLIVGAITFHIRKKWGFTTLSEPALTPFCGVWLSPKIFTKQQEQNSFVKKTLTELINQLPKVARYSFRFHYDLIDWQPFYWEGWQQTTRYTYVLDLNKEKSFYQNYNSNTKRNIQKAALLSYSMKDDFDKFSELNKQTYLRQKIDNSFYKQYWQKAENILAKEEARLLFFAKNTEGISEAAMYVVLDKPNKTAYYLGGGSTDWGRQNGAMYGLMHTILQECKNLGIEKFDFEGSMLKGIEYFFRGFGGELKPYFHVWKHNKLFGLIDILR